MIHLEIEIDRLRAENKSLREMLIDCIERYHQYEIGVDNEPLRHYREFVYRVSQVI